MPVKHLLALSPIALAATLAGALPESQPPATATSAAPPRAFTVATDRPDGLYRQGEPVAFSIRMTEDGQTVTGRTLAYTLVTNKTLWIYPEAGHLLHGRKIELKTKDP